MTKIDWKSKVVAILDERYSMQYILYRSYNDLLRLEITGRSKCIMYYFKSYKQLHSVLLKGDIQEYIKQKQLELDKENE